MNLFRDLSPQEENEFRQWAKDNYKPFDPIKGIWYPVIQDECAKINAACGGVSLAKKSERLNA